MISPMTKPGTKVVWYKLADGASVSHRWIFNKPATVDEIIKDPLSISGFVCLFVETPGEGACISLIRRLDLPESLTSLLNVKPVDAPQRETAQ